MYSTLLSKQQMEALAESPDFNALIAQLKPTEYGPYLDQAKEKDLTPRRAAFEIRGRLTDAYISIIRMAPEDSRPLLTQLLKYFELDNLKAVLRGIVAGSSWDRVRFVLFPLGSHSVLPAREMVESGNMATAVELLRGTPYHGTLSHAMIRFSVERSIFPLEVALDLDYWRELWKHVNELTGEDLKQALRIVGGLLDMNNLMWAIRYRVYHNLSEEELINYTLPFGHKVKDKDIRAIAAGADIAQVVKRIYPDLADVESLLQEPRKGLAELELRLKRHVMKKCVSAFIGNPFHIGIPLAFLQLLEIEIQDLTVLMEAKSAKDPHVDFRSFLVMGQAPRG